MPSRAARAGPHSAAITTAARGDQRAFILYVHPSKVTQTVLGLAYRALYYTVRLERCLERSAQLDWTSLVLRVRSGAFTRHETLHFDTEDAAYVLEGMSTHC